MMKLLFGLAFVAPLALSAAAAQAKCPVSGGKTPTIYGIGGSTMGTLLGPMLDKVFGEHDIEFRRWGKASSGLARPDFHDWPKSTPAIMDKHTPDIVVVSLGTNDYQPLWDDGDWIRQDDPKWETTYGERVDALLTAITASDKDRLVIWSGPYAFDGKNAVVRAPIVNRIMKERVEAFAKNGGNAIFHDAYSVTADGEGKPLEKAVLPGKGKKAVEIRTKDGVHLTADAVRSMLAQPIVEMVLPCFAKNEGEREAKDPTSAPKAP